MKFIQFSIVILFFSLSSALNFDPDDWYAVKKMGSISSFTEDNYSVFILADNGIFTIDKASGNIEYNVQLYDDFKNPQKIYFIWAKLSILNSYNGWDGVR